MSPDYLEEQIADLIKVDYVTSGQGINEYVLTGNENLPIIRAFSDSQKVAKFEEPEEIFLKCEENLTLNDLHRNHIAH